LPVGWYAVLIAVTGVWGVLRELLCRTFHENATLLCHFISWDFRIDTMCLSLLVIVVYPLLHFVRLRREPLRVHLYYLAGFFVTAVIIRLIATLIPGEWEAWIG
jgi:Na+/serine symporter